MTPVESVTSNRLRDMITCNKLSVLVLDCRPFIAYNSEHIQSSCNVLCPSILKRRSGGFLSLEHIIPCEPKRTKLKSGQYSTVVIYDELSQDMSRLACDSNIVSVLKSLRAQIGHAAIYFLKGGFTEFRKSFPDLCTSRQSFELVDPDPSTTVVVTNGSSSRQNDPVEIVPYLYLGDSVHASNKDLLRRLGITALLNVSTTCHNHFPDDFRYKTIPVDDTSCADLSFWFPQAINFIDSTRLTGGRCLIHCVAGVSRSATICMAYVMYSQHRTLDDAFTLVKSRRSVVSPNLNFMRQLHEYERQLKTTQPKLVSLSCPSSASATCAKSFSQIWNSIGSHQDLSEFFTHTALLEEPTLSSPLRSLSSPLMCPSPLVSPS